MRASTMFGIERQRGGESLLSLLVIFGTAKAFEDSIHMTRAETVVGQSEFGSS
jgi:hypothetical protein